MSDRLYQRRWAPAAPARAQLLIVHGHGEHSGRYGHLAEALTARGLLVHAYDQRGHGQSPGKRGRVDSFGGLLNDLAAQLGEVRAEAGETPLFLLGHSMGGLVAASYLAGGTDDVAGAVISSPLLAIPEHVSPWLLRLAGVLGTGLPWLPVDRLQSSAISRIGAEVAAYDADPLVYHGAIDARTGAQLSRAIEWTAARLADIRVPLMVIHGTADRLAPCAGGRRLFDEAGSAEKTGLFVEGGYHELFNDIDGEATRAAVVDWLAARMP